MEFLEVPWGSFELLGLSRSLLVPLSYFSPVNPIPGKLWNYVVRQGGAIMARTDFRLSKVAKRPISTQNLLSNRYFNL